MTECYECQPKPAQKTFPGCTIRNTPSEPIHCIVWAKHLFKWVSVCRPAEINKSLWWSVQNRNSAIKSLNLKRVVQICKFSSEKAEITFFASIFLFIGKLCSVCCGYFQKEWLLLKGFDYFAWCCSQLLGEDDPDQNVSPNKMYITWQ